jgi:hypothetical protein
MILTRAMMDGMMNNSEKTISRNSSRAKNSLGLARHA